MSVTLPFKEILTLTLYQDLNNKCSSIEIISLPREKESFPFASIYSSILSYARIVCFLFTFKVGNILILIFNSFLILILSNFLVIA